MVYGQHSAPPFQVNGGALPPHVVPFCAVAAVLAAILPVASFFLARASTQMQECQPQTQPRASFPRITSPASQCLLKVVLQSMTPLIMRARGMQRSNAPARKNRKPLSPMV